MIFIGRRCGSMGDHCQAGEADGGITDEGDNMKPDPTNLLAIAGIKNPLLATLQFVKSMA
jgi:hypothetical protein